MVTAEARAMATAMAAANSTATATTTAVVAAMAKARDGCVEGNCIGNAAAAAVTAASTTAVKAAPSKIELEHKVSQNFVRKIESELYRNDGRISGTKSSRPRFVLPREKSLTRRDLLEGMSRAGPWHAMR